MERPLCEANFRSYTRVLSRSCGEDAAHRNNRCPPDLRRHASVESSLSCHRFGGWFDGTEGSSTFLLADFGDGRAVSPSGDPNAHRKGSAGRQACRQPIELETLRVQHRQQRPHSGPPSTRNLAEYISRPPISLKKIRYEPFKGGILFHTAYSEYFKLTVFVRERPPFRRHRVHSAMICRAELTQHVPPKELQLIRRYGIYSSRTKGRWEELNDISRRAPAGWQRTHGLATYAEDAPGFEPSARICHYPKRWRLDSAQYKQAWARLLAKVYEVDPFICSRCGSEMKVIAVIQDPKLSAHTQQRSKRFLPT